MDRYAFRWEPLYRWAALPFGVTPANAWVEVDDRSLTIRFGPWKLHTALANVASCEQSGDYALVKTAGPARLSLVDRGVTFATNHERGLCIRFVEPVPAIDPLGRIEHPGATVTVQDVDALAEHLDSRRA